METIKIEKVKKLIPELRFKGFDGEWKIKKLGNLGSIISGLTYSPKDIDENGTLVLRSSNVQNDALYLNDNVYVNVKPGTFNPVVINDILICVRNGSKRLIGKNTLITEEVKGVAFGAFMTVYRSEYNLFLLYFFSSKEYYKEIHKNLGATINSINGSDLKKFKVGFPSLPEQQKIASFLSAVDNKIQQLTRKKELLEQYKKGVMQQLFSGKLRFKDENGKEYADWSLRKISDVLYEHKLKSTGKEEVFSVSVHKGLINQIEHLGRVFAAKNTDNYNLVKTGDIVYTKSPTGSFPLGIIKQSKVNKDVIVSPLYGIFTPETKGLGYMLNVYFESSINVNNYLASIIQKGAKNTINITNTAFLSKKMKLPVSKDEQNKIGDLLEQLDSKIESTTQQINQTQTFKKGLLQKMFV
jgi:type I restriction enzyme S subunit